VVIELAVFPQNGKPFSVSLNDISVRIDGAQTADKPVSATVVSAALQKKANHDHDITISPVTEVGYETGGYDDPTRVGDRSHGVYTAAGVGIGIGKSSGASDQDRSDMKTELSEKGLPEGSITAPVAGFVYFEIPPKNKNTHYQMKYAVNGTSITLALQ
jgi:hypothetical protein